ncbi:hypothetical protein [Wenjunlia tyrosinilytica]|nr:hypothetical protein [Wenjunlia tyrosinilytica]
MDAYVAQSTGQLADRRTRPQGTPGSERARGPPVAGVGRDALQPAVD